MWFWTPNIYQEGFRGVFQCGWMETWFRTPNIYQEGFRGKELNWCPPVSFRTTRPIISPIRFLFQQTKQVSFFSTYFLKTVLLKLSALSLFRTYFFSHRKYLAVSNGKMKVGSWCPPYLITSYNSPSPQERSLQHPDPIFSDESFCFGWKS